MSGIKRPNIQPSSEHATCSKGTEQAETRGTALNRSGLNQTNAAAFRAWAPLPAIKQEAFGLDCLSLGLNRSPSEYHLCRQAEDEVGIERGRRADVIQLCQLIGRQCHLQRRNILRKLLCPAGADKNSVDARTLYCPSQSHSRQRPSKFHGNLPHDIDDVISPISVPQNSVEP